MQTDRDPRSEAPGGTVIRPIAVIRTDFNEKFGIPRQSGLVEAAEGCILLEPEYRQPEALRGLEQFTHLWLIWQFSEAPDTWHATVRPPRLGGNTRIGVFASRSPFRPNRLGLSCVRLLRIEETPEGPVPVVAGCDLLDGTPIFDIKPYIPVADCRPDASEGYTAETRLHSLRVAFSPSFEGDFPPEKKDALCGILAQDPRPGYSDDPERVYVLRFAGYNVRFRVENGTLTVLSAGADK